MDTEKSAAITLNLAAKEAEQESAIVEDGTADNNDGGTLNPNITWNGNWSVWSGEKLTESINTMEIPKLMLMQTEHILNIPLQVQELLIMHRCIPIREL